jgi:hypothetical protein
MVKPIQLDEGVILEIEDNNYILKYQRKGGKRKRYDVGGYFPTLATLLQDYVINSPARSSRVLTTLKEVVDHIKATERRVAHLLK